MLNYVANKNGSLRCCILVFLLICPFGCSLIQPHFYSQNKSSQLINAKFERDAFFEDIAGYRDSFYIASGFGLIKLSMKGEIELLRWKSVMHYSLEGVYVDRVNNRLWKSWN